MRRTLSASAATLVGSRWPWSWLPHACTVCPCTGSRRGLAWAPHSHGVAGRGAPPPGGGGGRGRPPRQRTLRTNLDWSYRLLSAPERLLLGRLAVFSGGWTLAAAEAVCTDDDATVQYIADDLSQLVTRSLVQAEQVGDGSVRYGFLDTTRAYAAEQLVATGGDAGLRARHAAYMLGLAEHTL